MPLLYLIRHGRVTDHPTDPDDPQLGAEGMDQARAAARELQARLPRPLPILTSPLRRCRETAAPLAELWRAQAAVEPRVIEIPSPPDTARQPWIKRALVSTWAELDRQDPARRLADWRRGVHEAMLACREDTVIFSHYMPINVIVGIALGREHVSCFRPDNASVTVIEAENGRLRLVELGREMTTRVV